MPAWLEVSPSASSKGASIVLVGMDAGSSSLTNLPELIDVRADTQRSCLLWPPLNQGVNSRAVDSCFSEVGLSQVADPHTRAPRGRQAVAKTLQMVPPWPPGQQRSHYVVT